MKKITTLLLIFTTSLVFSQVPSYVPTNGLLGWWPFTGNANDLSGNGNNGTVNGAMLTSDRNGVLNNAYNFDGNNDFIIIPSNNDFNSNNISFSLWISSSNLQKQIAIVRTNFSNASNEHFALSFNFLLQHNVTLSAKYNVPNCNAGQGWQHNTHTQNIMNNNFHHIVGSIEGNTMKLYINNQLSQTLTTSFPQTSSCWGGDIQIGRNWSSFTDYFNGKIDDIGIWNRALTQQEITNLYNASLSTEDFSINTINIYPNPTTSLLNFKSAFQVEKITIYNMLGQLVQQEKVNALEGTINIEKLAQGTYLVKVNDIAKGYTIIKN
jgi:hypothetical protein